MNRIRAFFHVEMPKKQRRRRAIFLTFEYIVLLTVLFFGIITAWKNSYNLMNKDPITVFTADRQGDTVNIVFMNSEYHAEIPDIFSKNG